MACEKWHTYKWMGWMKLSMKLAFKKTLWTYVHKTEWISYDVNDKQTFVYRVKLPLKNHGNKPNNFVKAVHISGRQTHKSKQNIKKRSVYKILQICLCIICC